MAPVTTNSMPMIWFTDSLYPKMSHSRIALKSASVHHMVVMMPTLVPLICEKYTVISLAVDTVRKQQQPMRKRRRWVFLRFPPTIMLLECHFEYPWLSLFFMQDIITWCTIPATMPPTLL